MRSLKQIEIILYFEPAVVHELGRDVFQFPVQLGVQLVAGVSLVVLLLHHPVLVLGDGLVTVHQVP